MAALSREEVARFERDGYLVLERVFEERELAPYQVFKLWPASPT